MSAMTIESDVCGAAHIVNSGDGDGATFLTGPAVDVAGILRREIERLGHKSEAIGFGIGYSPSYWTRVLSCERGVLLDRLGRLELDVQVALVSKWAVELGLRIERRDASARKAAVLALAQAAQALADTL
jgi:hypothetical protein